MATCQLLFHSIALIEIADHKVKEERRGSKEEMLLRSHSNGRTHRYKQLEFQSCSALKTEATWIQSQGFLPLNEKHLPICLICENSHLLHHSLQQRATPKAGNQIMTIAQGLSISETSFLVHSKALPYPHMIPFKRFIQ